MANQEIIKQLVFGVAFNHMFKLLDMWGEIADDVLYNNKFFSAEFFTNISSQYTTERSLFNPKTGNQLTITANNLVFTQNIAKNFEREYEDFKNRVVHYILPSILSSYGLVVRRLGMVFTIGLKSDAMKKFSSIYFNSAVQGITDFRFSKKEAINSSLLISEKNDFINKIFSVGNFGEGTQGISYDYQLHFSPIRQDVRDNIDSFLKQSYSEFNKDIIENIGDQ